MKAAPVMTPAEREALIVNHLYIAEAEAGKYSRKCPAIPRDDHYSAGVLGLMKAADAYDPARGCVFKTVAGWWVKGEIKHQIRAWSRPVRNAPAGTAVQVLSLDALRPAGLHSDGDTMLESLPDAANVQAEAFNGLDAADISAAVEGLPPDWALAVRHVLLDGVSWLAFGAARGWNPSQTKQFARRFKGEIGARLRSHRGVSEMTAGGTVEIPLTNGGAAQVDTFDADRIAGHRWHQDPRGFAYAMDRHGVHRLKVRMHHAVVGTVPARHRVVARNRDLLDCRRSNLVIVPAWQAYHLQACRKAKRARFKGVFYNARLEKWGASITVHGEVQYLGAYGSQRVAAEAYDRAAVQYLGDWATTNFPQQKGSFSDAW